MIYDIGAHDGRWSEMAQAVFSPETIVLFEPQQEFQKRSMARQPGTGGKWTMMPVALGNEEAKTMLNVTAASACSSLLKPHAEAVPSWGLKTERQEEVRVARLDALVQSDNLPAPDLVKLDVQGYEQAVLEGGRETFAQARRGIVEVSLYELYDGQALLPEVLQRLCSLGFALDDLSDAGRPWPEPPAQLDLWLTREPLSR